MYQIKNKTNNQNKTHKQTNKQHKEKQRKNAKQIKTKNKQQIAKTKNKTRNKQNNVSFDGYYVWHLTRGRPCTVVQLQKDRFSVLCRLF